MKRIKRIIDKIKNSVTYKTAKNKNIIIRIMSKSI